MISLYIASSFRSSFSVRTNCISLANLLFLKYGKYISKSDIHADFFITVLKTPESFSIYAGSETYTTDDPLSEIDRIIFENTVYNCNIFALHGASVEYSGKAYLFLASTFSGKSTLTSYLTSNGFGYITDDCILLDKKNFCIHPCNVPIALRNGGLDVLKQYNAVPDSLELIDFGSIRRYVYTPENSVSQELPIGKIFFITRTDNKNEVLDISSIECMKELMKSPITCYPVTGDYVRFISRLAQSDCRQLYYSDINYIAKIIQNG